MTKRYKLPIIVKIKGDTPFMDKNILCIEISKNDVYVEYENRDFEYISFTKAKKLIYKTLPTIVKYSCVDSEKSVNFLNTLLTKYKLCDDSLVLHNK